jgi:hypothetical protein
MADPKNPGYTLELHPTADPDVVRVVESDDLLGPAPARNVSAVEAGRLHAAAVEAPVVKKAPARKKS